MLEKRLEVARTGSESAASKRYLWGTQNTLPGSLQSRAAPGAERPPALRQRARRGHDGHAAASCGASPLGSCMGTFRTLDRVVSATWASCGRAVGMENASVTGNGAVTPIRQGKRAGTARPKYSSADQTYCRSPVPPGRGDCRAISGTPPMRVVPHQRPRRCGRRRTLLRGRHGRKSVRPRCWGRRGGPQRGHRQFHHHCCPQWLREGCSLQRHVACSKATPWAETGK